MVVLHLGLFVQDPPPKKKKQILARSRDLWRKLVGCTAALKPCVTPSHGNDDGMIMIKSRNIWYLYTCPVRCV